MTDRPAAVTALALFAVDAALLAVITYTRWHMANNGYQKPYTENELHVFIIALACMVVILYGIIKAIWRMW